MNIEGYATINVQAKQEPPRYTAPGSPIIRRQGHSQVIVSLQTMHMNIPYKEKGSRYLWSCRLGIQPTTT
jgi:hypothetical protein